MEELSFRGNQTLPRRGTVRVQNFGASPHIAIAFPLRSGVTNAQAGRAIRSGRDAAIGRIVGGAPTFLHTAEQQGVSAELLSPFFALMGRRLAEGAGEEDLAGVVDLLTRRTPPRAS